MKSGADLGVVWAAATCWTDSATVWSVVRQVSRRSAARGLSFRGIRFVVLVAVQAEDRGFRFVACVGRGFVLNRDTPGGGPSLPSRGRAFGPKANSCVGSWVWGAVPDVPRRDLVTCQVGDPRGLRALPDWNRKFSELTRGRGASTASWGFRC